MPLQRRLGSSEEDFTPTNVKKSIKDALSWKQISQPIPTGNVFAPQRLDNANSEEATSNSRERVSAWTSNIKSERSPPPPSSYPTINHLSFQKNINDLRKQGFTWLTVRSWHLTSP
jgi:hypothetical protein